MERRTPNKRHRTGSEGDDTGDDDRVPVEGVGAMAIDTDGVQPQGQDPIVIQDQEPNVEAPAAVQHQDNAGGVVSVAAWENNQVEGMQEENVVAQVNEVQQGNEMAQANEFHQNHDFVLLPPIEPPPRQFVVQRWDSFAEDSPPRSILNTVYSQNFVSDFANHYITWSRGPAHAQQFTGAFVCPLTGETWYSGRSDRSAFHGRWVQDRPHDFVWYQRSSDAAHAAAAMAYDALRHRYIMQNPPQDGNEETRLTNPEEVSYLDPFIAGQDVRVGVPDLESETMEALQRTARRGRRAARANEVATRVALQHEQREQRRQFFRERAQRRDREREREQQFLRQLALEDAQQLADMEEQARAFLEEQAQAHRPDGEDNNMEAEHEDNIEQEHDDAVE